MPVMKKSVVLSAVLSALGYSCGTGCTEQRDMYGTPYAVFEVKGRVVDGNGAPVGGIRVGVNLDGEQAAGFSGPQGDYAVSMDIFRAADLQARVKAEDVDGEAGGGCFAADSTDVGVAVSDFKNPDRPWYGGKATREVNFTLKKKI